MTNVIQRKSKYTERHMNAEAKGLDPDYYQAYGTVYDKVAGRVLSNYDKNLIVNILHMSSIKQATEYFLSLDESEFKQLVDKYGNESDIVKKAKSDRRKAKRKANRKKRKNNK